MISGNKYAVGNPNPNFSREIPDFTYRFGKSSIKIKFGSEQFFVYVNLFGDRKEFC